MLIDEVFLQGAIKPFNDAILFRTPRISKEVNYPRLFSLLIKLFQKLTAVICLNSRNRIGGNLDKLTHEISCRAAVVGLVDVGKSKLGNNINSGNDISFNPMFKPNDGINLKKISGVFDFITKYSLFIRADIMLGSFT